MFILYSGKDYFPVSNRKKQPTLSLFLLDYISSTPKKQILMVSCPKWYRMNNIIPPFIRLFHVVDPVN